MMSSATSTESVRPAHAQRRPASQPPLDRSAEGVRPWQFFLAAALGLAALAVYAARQQPGPVVALTALTVLAAGYAGFMLYRTVGPLVGEHIRHDAPMVAGRTRVALERDKTLTLRAIKELEFDRAMGKVAEADFTEMRERLRARAVRLLRELDGATAYRARIEADVAARIAKTGGASAPSASSAAPSDTRGVTCVACGAPGSPDARFCTRCGASLSAQAADRICRGCGTSNEADARFCKHCGTGFAIAT
jgi:hypothetical protein